MMEKLSFNNTVKWICQQIPYVGKDLENIYFRSPKFQRFTKYSTVLLLQFWLLRIPMIWFFTEVTHIWYGLSDFMAAIILAILGFFYSELWIWKGKKNG